jgi:hypothetical protein
MSKEPNRAGASEQTFFADPALDRALGVVMALATEVYVLRDRLRAVEALLDKAGVVSIDDLDAPPTAAALQAGEADRQAFIAGLMEPLLGRQASRGMVSGGETGHG